ncbi:hypothetical protein D3C87_1911110 [compost metagenome]
MAADLGLAVHVDRHFGVLAANFTDEAAQAQDDGVEAFASGKLFIVNGQNKRTGPALLLGKLREVTVAGDADHLKALGLDGLRQRTNAQARCVL